MIPGGVTSAAAVLGIGTAAYLANYGLPGDTPVARADLDDTLRRAVERGICYLDTAPGYGDSEIAVGTALADGVRVCTKIPASGSLDDVQRSVARLGAAPDTILIHSAGREALGSAPAIAALQEARSRGLLRRAGASTYGGDDATFALAQSWVEVVQIEYSILNQSVFREAARTRASQEVVVRSVLCKGLLTSRRRAAPDLALQVKDALDGIEACAREWNRSVENLAIRFALDTPGIDVVLVGVSNPRELDVALAAERSPRLTHDQWQQLAAFNRADLDATHPERWGRA